MPTSWHITNLFQITDIHVLHNACRGMCRDVLDTIQTTNHELHVPSTFNQAGTDLRPISFKRNSTWGLNTTLSKSSNARHQVCAILKQDSWYSKGLLWCMHVSTVNTSMFVACGLVSLHPFIERLTCRAKSNFGEQAYRSFHERET